MVLTWAGAACMLPLHAGEKARGDSAYAAGRYEEAIAAYTSLLKRGEHADVYYNLGNCYYKTDRPALAILNYERAALMNPGDADIRFNLEAAREKTIDRITPEREMFFVAWYEEAADMAGADGWGLAGVCLFAGACASSLLFFLCGRTSWRKCGFFGALAMLSASVLANVFARTQEEELNARRGAVVTSSSVVVKSSPDESGTDLFVLHEGTRVEITDGSMREWKEIRVADGKSGWMRSGSMEVI